MAKCGNLYFEMKNDLMVADVQMEFFAGLVTEMKGDTIPIALGQNRKEDIGELIALTKKKNIHIELLPNSWTDFRVI